MKNSLVILFKTACSSILLLTTPPVFAQVAQTNQKLPDQQEISLRAPSTTKVDGKITEWNHFFQAYNKSTQVFYTLSNDDTNLYLTLQAGNSDIASKILMGGLTLNVNTAGKKKPGIMITFPVPNANSMRDMFTGMRSSFEKMQGMDQATMKKYADSLTYAMNRQRIDKLKDLKITGVKELPDSVLSIYNEEGIKARALFDNTGAYNYELAVPLKYLGISADNPKEFLYNIKLNGPMAAMGGGMGMGGTPAVAVGRASIGGGNVNFGGGDGMAGPRVVNIGGRGAMDIMSMISPTDFWGKYTPAQK